MKYHVLILPVAILCAPSFVYGACSTANLTRCLDSVCAINIGANPAARCQYCGSASAGDPTKSTAMKNVSAGSATKYIISDKELKSAPTDPGQRYIWATQKCLEKVSGCTTDDVSDTYDELISKSCQAAGIADSFTNLAKKANTAKTQTTCSNDITSCIIDDKHCGTGYAKCESESDFDKHFADCGVLSNGCETYLSDIRASVYAARANAFKNADAILKSIIASYQDARQQKLISTEQGCKDGSSKQQCIKNVCANMHNKCSPETEYETVVADELCKFYDIACDRLKQERYEQ